VTAASTEPDKQEARQGRKLLHGLIWLVVLVLIVVGLLLAVPGLKGVANTVTRMKGGWVAAAVAFEILSCLGYVLAFLQVFDRAPIRFGARVALAELAFQSAVSLGGAGSVALGAWLLVERGASVNRVAERSAVLFLLTSAINVITFALVGLGMAVRIIPGKHNLLLTLLPGAVGTIVLVFFLMLPRLIERGMTRKLPHKLQVGLNTLEESIIDTRVLLVRPDWRIVGAIGYLWFDIAVLVACLHAAGASLPIGSIVLAYQIAYLSNAIPIPGGIGVLDGSLVGTLVLYGGHATTATAATVVYHAISLWIPAMWGTVAFLILRRTRNQPLELRPPRDERRRMRGSVR
jgi:uncharacterized membrane protein YbhN (UPF0104 family)